jgi:hypothetical protein
VKEGGRLGVEVGLFNCPGWSQSGGPWIKPEQAMRYVAFSELRVTGPARFEQKLPAPGDHFQDIAVLAFPAPREEGTVIASKAPRLTCSPALAQAGRLVDGDRSTEDMFPAARAGNKAGSRSNWNLLNPSPRARWFWCRRGRISSRGASSRPRIRRRVPQGA